MQADIMKQPVSAVYFYKMIPGVQDINIGRESIYIFCF